MDAVAYWHPVGRGKINLMRMIKRDDMKYIFTVAILFLAALSLTMAETHALAQATRTPEETVRRLQSLGYAAE